MSIYIVDGVFFFVIKRKSSLNRYKASNFEKLEIQDVFQCC